MEKVFKCQEIETDVISVANLKDTNQIFIEIFDQKKEEGKWVNLSKPDAIEFCRELLKQIAMLE